MWADEDPIDIVTALGILAKDDRKNQAGKDE